MKRITLIALCASVAAGSVQAVPVKLPAIFKSKAKATRATDGRKYVKALAAKAAEGMPLWRAQTQKAYWWTGEDWELSETYEISYDDKGQKEVQTVEDTEGYASRETYTWNENGMLATRLGEVDEEGSGEFTESSRLSREYDSRLVSFITFNDQQVWNGNAWQPSNSYKQTITRDAAGNVTLMERAVYFQGVYDPTYRLAISYGEDGKAVEMVSSDLQYDYSSGEYYWEEGDRYSDIVWEETDGQIVSIEEIEDLFLGANRIKSAFITMEEGTARLEVKYNGPDSFSATLTFDNYDGEEGVTLIGTIEYAPLDFSDSDYSDVPAHLPHGWQLLTNMEMFYEDSLLGGGATRETYIYSPEDLILLEQVEIAEGQWEMRAAEEYEIESRTEGVVEYDEEHGYPLVWTVSEYDYDSGEMIPVLRAEYSDYIDAAQSAIQSIAPSSSSAPRYYNLQGHPVTNPTSGLYILVKGNKAEKVMLK